MLGLSSGARHRDPNDAIFSKLGLANDAHQLLPRPDYSQSCRETHTELALNYIHTKNSINILGAVDHSTTPDTASNDSLPNLNLPSWIPDWTKDSGFHISRVLSIASPELLFNAGLEVEFTLPADYDDQNEELTVQGFIFDTCRAKTIHPPRQARNMPKRLNPFNIIASFCRTACANHLLTNDWLVSDSVPKRDRELLVRMLQRHYLATALNKPGRWESLSLQTFHVWVNEFGLLSPRARQHFEKWATEWATFTLLGCNFADWVMQCHTGDDGTELWFCKTQDERERVIRLVHSIVNTDMMFNRKIMEMMKDGVAHVPRNAEPGDKICIILGCMYPMVLRPLDESGKKYRVVGGCYVSGGMHGDFMQEHLNDGKELQDFILI